MKSQIKKIAAAALLICSCAYVSAQVAPPVNTPLPPPDAPLGPQAPVTRPMRPNASRPPMQQQNLQSLTTISGKVTGYQTNDRYAYNSLIIETNSGNITVRFPEHLGQQLMNAAKKGETITVKGFNSNAPDGITAFQLVTAIAGGVQINDIPPAPASQPVTPEPKTYSGSISDFKRDPQGMINGINLDNKVVVDLPPPVITQLQALLKTGDKVEVSGFKDTPPAGVVLAANAPIIIHPQTITLNGQTYLVR